jgi:hypothetical protein
MHSNLTIAFSLALLLLTFMPHVAAQVGTSGDARREAFEAVAVSGGGPLTRPVATNLRILIDRWSTESERQRLFETLPKGQDAALETLRDLRPVGRIFAPGQLGWDLHYAHQVRGEDGSRRIFLATDRPIGIWEAINRPRTIDYPFTFIELRLNPGGEGKGEGKLSRATRIVSSGDGKYLQLENYGEQPVDLTEVRSVD